LRITKQARWIVSDSPAEDVEHLARALPLSEVAARVLWNRGYRDPDSARRFLNPSLDDLIDPSGLADMEKATARLMKAIRDGEKILVYGDYDVDGATSVVILKTAIQLSGGIANYHVPDRFGEGYGMRSAIIERSVSEGVKLIVSVDTGIRANRAVNRAVELGIDVIITDHHLPEEKLPAAYAVVNPNRLDCDYPTKQLCGAGVAFKLIQSLFRANGWSARKARQVEMSLLKMVSIATVADVVPLTGENRIIVKHGLDGLKNIRNPGLRALMDVAGLGSGDRPSAGQVAFRLAPRINAAGRMANASEVVELFLTSDAARARSLAEQLQELNLERQQTEAEMVNRILETCASKPVSDDERALVFAGDDWHRGVVGIVATRLVERFSRPVFVLSVDTEKGEAQGSGRSTRPFHLLKSLESMSDLFSGFGGHRQAAGLTLPATKVDEFRRRMGDYAASHLKPDDLRPVCDIDAAINFDEVNDRTVGDILSLEPFGFGNPAPVLMATGVTVDSEPSVFKEKHLRIPFRQNGRRFSVKAWNFAGRADEVRSGATVDIAFNFEDDRYAAARGYPGWGLVLRDVRPAD
jgi:single-stranded-DNA-specific exonuclease